MGRNARMASEWNGDGADVERVITAVKRELARAADAMPDLKLTAFELELSVVTKKETKGGAKFKFEVPIFGSISIGGSRSEETEATTKLKLKYGVPPKKKERPGVGVDLSELRGAVEVIQKSIHAAQGSEPKLNLTEGEITFAFGVTKESGGGIEIVILEGTVSKSRADEQTVTLTFEPKTA